MKRADFGQEPEDQEKKSGATLGKPAAASKPAAPQPAVEYIAEHTMKPDETLSHLALKYYGSAIREKWMVIYEANRAAIGDDPNHVKPGTVLKIPKIS